MTMLKRYFLVPILLLFLGLSMAYSQHEITIVSYNIWFDNPANTDNPWSDRKQGVIETLTQLEPDIFCVQEALINQVKDLTFAQFKHVGVGRDDGKNAGEFSAIFYDTVKFVSLNESTFWLSETPEVPGKKGWDAVCVRIVTWVHLKEIKTGNTFYVFNTHFDHVGDTARLESARLIKQEIKAIAKDEPVILTGDFNCRLDSKPYLVLINKGSAVSLADSRAKSEKPISGPNYSFIGNDFTGDPGNIIDHIFVSSPIKVKNAFILLNCKTRCPSDHLPVVAKLYVSPTN